VLPLVGIPYSLPLLAACTVVATVVARLVIRSLLRKHRLMPGSQHAVPAT
jgi:hypothetical protein